MPRVKELQKRHRSDKERMQRELREYYREHEISPLSAFLPLLVQIPVFISLLYVMRADAKSGLFGDAGLLFIPHLTDKPNGAVLVALVTTYLTSQIASSLIVTRTMRGGPSNAHHISVMRPFSWTWATVSTPLPVRSR